jgi:hypothetical protein
MILKGSRWPEKKIQRPVSRGQAIKNPGNPVVGDRIPLPPRGDNGRGVWRLRLRPWAEDVDPDRAEHTGNMWAKIGKTVPKTAIKTFDTARAGHKRGL